MNTDQSLSLIMHFLDSISLSYDQTEAMIVEVKGVKPELDPEIDRVRLAHYINTSKELCEYMLSKEEPDGDPIPNCLIFRKLSDNLPIPENTHVDNMVLSGEFFSTPEKKNEMCMIIGAHAFKTGADAVCLMNMAWHKTMKPGERREDLPKNLGDCDDRDEVQILNTIIADNSVELFAKVIRSPDSAPTMGPWEAMPTSKNYESEGYTKFKNRFDKIIRPFLRARRIMSAPFMSEDIKKQVSSIIELCTPKGCMVLVDSSEDKDKDKDS